MGIAATCIHGAGLCLIPQPKNNHHPLALRHGPLAFISTLLIVAKVVALGVIALTPASAELSTITSARIMQLTNAERTKRGLAPLALNSSLSAAAVQKGNHMLTEDYFAHISPSGVTPWFWMSKVGYSYQVAGENLAIDFIEAEDVVAAWIASPTHKDNMLHTQYTETGIGVVTGEFEGGTSTIVVHMFGLPSGAAAPAPAAPLSSPTPSPTVKASTSRQTAPKATASPSPSPIPAASPTPLATVLPSTAPGDSTPPRIPRIALLGSTVLQTTSTIKIEGEPGSFITLLVNGQPQPALQLPTSGILEHNLDITATPDGPITLTAYAHDSARNQSAPSTALAFTKDTASPALARENVSYIISPQTDSSTALLTVASPGYEQLILEQGEQKSAFAPGDAAVIGLTNTPFTLSLQDAAGNSSFSRDITLAPQFDVPESNAYLAPPTRFTQLTRRMTASIFVAILALLILAILIRIRIQHPLLIAHASFVLLLASVVFFW